jgi:proteasome lid subunit RPN8/RPN11
VFTRLLIPDSLLAELVAHARAEAPLECCGLLAGRVVDGAGVVAARYPIGNVARSATAYETDPRQLLLAFRAMRECGIELLAIYHSHPNSEPTPSPRDLAGNTYGESAVHLIVGLRGVEPEVRAWWLTTAGYRAVGVEGDRSSEPSRTDPQAPAPTRR